MPDDGVQLEVFPTCLHLQRIDTARNLWRFYRMTVQRDLFGRVTLVRTWGRIRTHGRERVDFHEDEGVAITALMKLAEAKRRRGYEP
ncbi:WGR domain-containing protein [Rhodobacter sphaeroides]|jgi:Uncharacterized conserved protein|uniref:WGR domain-containing protein n=1 Tax=Cereibacter sphaeroides (strain ATCC 17023 / DSM 158 / JCM 6121 / CCUG 31486 / LMG 2827 / NBRC 12203 / NCIMB 8253 / ATH 2.4.1.) TaxID=272943 RepID=U5NN13_CERS4|nr:WGR domain-containing protein [Cereibacter sphaeroides]AGY32493.1 hypothetical protein RSP_7664 [Cereibacter sphaeroides 2.4.1]AMJ50160.1 polymerase [Cereibacter sphaeroides]ANS36771.1 polymerase [Cereibacter sphaeroides]ATN65931.1 polymerase [Cereibacter sphaeroides]AXC64068.1 WGR domain-containing protein [Cereibacter sphaeroides 2.4.1]